MESIVIPPHVTSIGGECFSNCSRLSKIELPSTVTSFESRCFMNYVSLIEMELPSSFTKFGYGCFMGCTNLRSITVPASVGSISEMCFKDCDGLKTIHFLGNVPDILSTSYLNKNVVLYVPAEYLQEFKEKLGNRYSRIFVWKGDNDHPQCAMPTISYSDGDLHFCCSTPDVKILYSISSADFATKALAEDGKVHLVAAYDISAYATADMHYDSDVAHASIYWLNANFNSTVDIKETENRGIMVMSQGGILSISGLDDGESVKLFAIDGRLIDNITANRGVVSCNVSEPLVIVKIGEQSMKISMK